MAKWAEGALPIRTMTGHTNLVRMLRSFLESSNIDPNLFRFKYERSDDGKMLVRDDRVEGTISYDWHDIDIVLIAPTDKDEDEPTVELPNGRLAARRLKGHDANGDPVYQRIRGPLDIATWQQVAAAFLGVNNGRTSGQKEH